MQGNEGMHNDDPRTDEELLVATRGDPEAFGGFYDRHEDAILRFFLARVVVPDLAADLTAETFAAALVAVRRFRPGGPPAQAWLYGIARNVFAMSVRSGQIESRARRRLAMPRLELTDELLERLEDVGALAPAGDIAELLEGLPSNQRDAVQAHVIDERDYAEIARELRCSEAVVRKRVSRGLSALRERIEEER